MSLLCLFQHASVNHRRAILCFLTQLDVNELPLFFSLLLKPLFSTADGTSAHENQLDLLFDKFLALPLSFLQTESLSTMIAGLSSKKKFSFLHVVEDVLRSFDEFHVKPFLDLLLAIVVKILEWCTISVTVPSDTACSGIEDDSANGLKVWLHIFLVNRVMSWSFVSVSITWLGLCNITLLFFQCSFIVVLSYFCLGKKTWC